MNNKLLAKFNRLLSNKYIFHLHTNYTDGENSIHDYLEFAADHGCKSVVFTEHVHRGLSYDFDAFCNELDKKRKLFPELDVWLGIEAKILANGGLDAPLKLRDRIDVLCIACHSFPVDSEKYFQAMARVFQEEWVEKIRIWVHPGLFFLRNTQLMDNDNWQTKIEQLVALANRYGIFGEINVKYNLPMALFAHDLFNQTITGIDAHSIADLKQRRT